MAPPHYDDQQDKYKSMNSKYNYGSTVTENDRITPTTSNVEEDEESKALLLPSYQTTDNDNNSLKHLWSFDEDYDGRPSFTKRLAIKFVKLAVVVAVAYLALKLYNTITDELEDDTGDDDFSYQYTDNGTNDYHPLPPSNSHHAGGKSNSNSKNRRLPFSTVHPVELGVPQFSRPNSSRPSLVLTHHADSADRDDDNNDTNHPNRKHFPTNAWYQNMLLVADTEIGGTTVAEPTEVNRAYATPFLVDAVGIVPGLRVLPNHITASATIIQLNTNNEYGLTVGAAPNMKKTVEHAKEDEDKTRSLHEKKRHGRDTNKDQQDSGSSSSTASTTSTSDSDTTAATNPATPDTTAAPTKKFSNEYRVHHMTPLGLTLGWDKTYPMQSSIVKGMPYGTMVYETLTYESTVVEEDDSSKTSNKHSKKKKKETWYPTVASAIPLAQAPIVDGKIKMACLGGEQFFTSITATTAPASTGGSNSTTRKLKNKHSTTHNDDSNNTTLDTEDTNEEQDQGQYQVKVEKEIELFFADSDFTWLVFVSRPVTMQCVMNPDTRAMYLQVVDDQDEDAIIADGDDDIETNNNEDASSPPPFVMRIALAKFCTSNKDPIYCHHEQMIPYSLGVGQGRYDDLLRNHSRVAPGPHTDFDYDLDQTKQQINIVFDWDARDIANYNNVQDAKDSNSISMDHDLIAFALPHHLDLMGTRYAPGYLKYCASTLIGPACMLAGSKWTMVDTIPQIDFRAPRPPAPWAIEAIAKSAKRDINFQLPKLYQKGSGDTYFSGKMLAKAGRVLTITEELKELCSQSSHGDESIPNGYAYKEVCHGLSLPSDKEVQNAVAKLRSAVEVWLNGKAVTPFVYDDAWGGVVSCGCSNPDGGDCRNKFPECSAFADPGLNFGNAFYNDLHFHYGYHIYAAAVVSHFDPDWGKKFFERVLLLVRNIANPSDSGDYFPAFRHKDWYQGHSWASGVVPPFLNGRNQESSSESIAAYEAVALYGAVMKSIFEISGEGPKAEVARAVEEAGQVLTATELRSTRRYYHVRDEGNANAALKIYPREYSNHAIGMMWNTMAQYQTWFGGKPYLAAGIQLLPITPIAEQRDGAVWLSEMYPSFAATCDANKDCEENGWSVLQLASLATIGYQDEATKGAKALSPEVFESAGGNGHSLTNTLWFIATRPVVDDPIAIGSATESNTSGETAGSGGNATTEADDHKENMHVLTDCNVPEFCTDYVLDTIADEYTCRQRMTDLMDTKGQTQEEACFTVAKIQFPAQCGACVPNATETTKEYYKAQCPPCTVDQCESDLSRCPQFSQTFVCTNGPNKGGCSRFPWDVRSALCTSCCELTECLK